MMNITNVFGKQSASGKAAALFGAPQSTTSGEAVPAMQDPSGMLASVPEFLQVLLTQLQQSVLPEPKAIPTGDTLLGMKQGDSEASSDAQPADPAAVLFSGSETGVEPLNVRGVTPLLQWNRSKLQSLNAKPAAAAETGAVTKLSASADDDAAPVKAPVLPAESSPAVKTETAPSVVAVIPEVQSSESQPVMPDQFPAEAFRFPVTGAGVLVADEPNAARQHRQTLNTVQNIPAVSDSAPVFAPVIDLKNIPSDGEAKRERVTAEQLPKEKPVPAPVFAAKDLRESAPIPKATVKAEAAPIHTDKPEIRNTVETAPQILSEKIPGVRTKTETDTVTSERIVTELLNRFPAEQISVRKMSGTPEASPVLKPAGTEVPGVQEAKSSEPAKVIRPAAERTARQKEEARPAAAPTKQVPFTDASPRSSAEGSEQGASQRERSGQQLPAEAPVNNTGERTAPVPFEKAMAAPAVSADVRSMGRTAPVAAPLEPAVVPSLLEQLSRNIDMAIKQDRSEMKLTLNPESLGEVVVRVHVEDGKVNASLDVQQSTVKHIIEANMPQLREALTSKGLTMERIEVTTAQQGTADEMAKQQQGGGNKKRQWNDVMEDEDDSMKTMGYNTIEITM
jgi:flagellar hook-length control protein FliK